MKKLITLLLVLTGMVGTASAKTIFIKNNCGWPQMRSYQWGGSQSSEEYMFINSTVNVATITVENDTYFTVSLDDTNQTKFILEKNYNSGNEKTNDLDISSVTEGSFYEFEYVGETNGTKYYKLKENSVYSYSFSVNTAEGVSISKIYLWVGSGSSATPLVGAYPGSDFSSTYNYRTYTDRGTINVIFNQGSGQPQTCDLTASEGDNSYYIASIGSESTKGEAVKTNGYGYSTYTSTNNLTIPSDIAYCAEDNGTGSATAHTVTNPAGGIAMLIKGNANTTYHFATSSGSTDLGYTNAFKAGGSTIYSQDNGNYNYVLNGDAFYLAKSETNGGTTVASGKAYLQLSKQAGAGARVLKFMDDETEGITAISAAKATDGAYYNLSGQRVNAPMKGLYIQNGKKIIVK